MLYVCPFEKIHFLIRIDRDALGKKFNNGTFMAPKLRHLTAKNFKFHAHGQWHIRLCQFGV